MRGTVVGAMIRSHGRARRAPAAGMRATRRQSAAHHETVASMRARTWWPGLCVAWVLALPAVGAAAGLRLGLSPIPSTGLAHLARAQGFFAAQGLPDIEFITCTSGGDCAGRLVKGEFDITLASDTSAVVTTQEGGLLDVVATTASSRTSNRVVARRAAGLERPEQLRGKRVGYIPGTSSHYFTEAFLNYHGIDVRDVTMVALDARRAVDQLVAGEVDAAGLFHPQAPLAQQRLGEQGLTFPIPPIYTVTVNLLTRPGTSDDMLERVLRALLQAEDYLKAEPARARDDLARQLGIATPMIDAMLREFEFRVGLNQSLLVSLESQARWSKRSTLVDNRATVDYFERMRPAPLRRIDPRRVTLIK